MFSMINNEQGLLRGFCGFRLLATGVGLPNSTAAAPAGIVIFATGPPTLTEKVQLA